MKRPESDSSPGKWPTKRAKSDEKQADSARCLSAQTAQALML
jgi:hypothetical protein